MLTQARLKELFHYDPDSGLFTRLAARAHNAKVGVAARGSLLRNGYAVFNVEGKVFYAHRLAWLYVHGTLPPKGIDIDHINRDKADNRLANLRLLSRVLNSHNRGEPKHNTSGRKGVYRLPGDRWKAQIQLHGKVIHLGMFATFEAAVAARSAAETKMEAR